MIKIMNTLQRVSISRLESPELENFFAEDNKMTANYVYG